MTTARRRAREKEQRREAILEAARLVFFNKGFRRATVDDVAAQAEISKGTIYLYFPSKEALLAHLLLDGLSMLLAALEAAYQPDDSLPASQQIRNLAHAYLRFSQQYPDYFRLMVAFDRGRFQEQISPQLNREILDESMRCLKVLAHAVESGRDRGEFAVEDTWETAGILWAALNGVLVLMAHPVRRQMVAVELERMFDDTLDLLLRGLGRAS